MVECKKNKSKKLKTVKRKYYLYQGFKLLILCYTSWTEFS